MHKGKQIMRELKCAVCMMLAVLMTSMLAGCEKYSTNLNGVFGFDFDMTLGDIIEYEANTYFNRDYSYDDRVNRYDFYQDSGNTDHVHMYFFDSETGKLVGVRYTNRTGGNDPDHWHIENLKSAVLARAGDWDETSGSLFYIYGTINGVKCQVTYSNNAFFVDRSAE